MSHPREFPRDGIGNEIKTNDIVRVELDKPYVIGKVMKVEAAGSIHIPIVGAHDKKDPNLNTGVIPGRVYIIVEMTSVFAPGKAIADLLVLKKPDKEPEPIIYQDSAASAS